MSLTRVPLFPVLLAAVLAAAPSASAAAGGAEAKPGIPKWIETVGDVDKPDKQRARARDRLAARGAVDDLIKLWKSTKDENVRMHVAIALAKVKQGRDVIDKNLGVLVEGLTAKDAALRYWTVFAMANARTAKALQIVADALKTALVALEDKTKPKEGADKPAKTVRRVTDEERLILAIARAIGSMGKDVLVNERRTLLLGASLLGNRKHPGLRIGAIEGLRLWGRKTAAIVLPLFKVAKTDPDERVWRAAVEGVMILARTKMFIQPPPPGCSEALRQKTLAGWEAQWKIEERRRKPRTTG